MMYAFARVPIYYPTSVDTYPTTNTTALYRLTQTLTMGSSYSTEDIPSLEGKVAIITGASAGIGKICALEMARQGCHVVLACRSEEKTIPVVDQIKEETKNDKVRFTHYLYQPLLKN